MAQIIDINQAEIRRSLNEAIAWCTHRQLTAEPIDKVFLSRRFQMMDEASDLMRQAYQECQRGWNWFLRRDYSKSPKYKRGQELFAEAGRGSSASFAQRLRTPDLKASLDYREAPDDKARKRIVEKLIAKRHESVAKLEHRQMQPHAIQGRLLSYWPDENLACGAAEVQSLGFFDADNTPPWDLWVAFSDRMLLSWVPGELVEIAQRGIDINPEGCIAWFQ
jgi:hypothetical protein